MAVTSALALTVPVAVTTTAAQAEPATTPNAVITWNIHAQTAIYEVARQPPTPAARSFAIVQGAVYDAVNAIAGTPYQPYLVAPRSRPGDSTPAAVATAAHHVLLSIFPGQAESLRAQYDEALAAIPDGPSERGGIAVGEAAAAAMIDARRDDGFDPLKPWPEGTAPGQWRPTPPRFQNVGGWPPDLKPFVIDPGDYRTPGPPALTSRAYAGDLNEIKAIGSLNSKVRKSDQTDAAKWWDDFRMVEWSINRQLATTHRLGNLQTARMFAMVYVSAADAVIPCYQEKKRWNLWRPVTAIPLAHTDGNPATRPDPKWTPLRETAPSPEYPSGHACFTTATMEGLRKFFGRDDVSFSAFSEDSGTTRRFNSLSKAAAELAEARVWAGVHYRFASDDGDRLGAKVARDVLDRAFGRRGE